MLRDGQQDSYATLEEPPRHSKMLNDDLAALNHVSQIPPDYVFPVVCGVTEVDHAESNGLQLAISANHQLHPSFDYEKSRTHLEIYSGSAQSEQSRF